MPTTKATSRSRSATARAAKPALPSVSMPGYVPDEVFDRVRAQLRTMTPASFRRHLVKCGILDAKGNRLGPVQ